MPYTPLHRSTEQDAELDRILALARAAGPGHVAILDVDGCLFDTRTRTLAILQAFAETHGHYALRAVRVDHFEDRDRVRTFRNAGIEADLAEELAAAFEPFWGKRFFVRPWQLADTAMPGGSRLTRELWEAGLELLYLTGRIEDTRPDTRTMLLRHGFPLDVERTHLWMKPSDEESDLAYKARTLDAVTELGSVVLAFENEPRNANAIGDRFGDAHMIWVHTDHSSSFGPHGHFGYLDGFLRTTDRVPDD